MVFSETSRKLLLDEVFDCMRQYLDLSEKRQQAGPERGVQYTPHIQRLADRQRELNVQYREGLPTVPMSRCPYTQQLYSHSWDPFGLDGLWWDFHKPIRPLREPHGGKFHALSGAVLLQPDAVPDTPFLVEPGPQRPFLLPRLMEFPSIRAVVSQLQLGPHTAYPIVYFSDPSLPPEDGANDWGCHRYLYTDSQGATVTGEYYDAEDEHLYELDSWIESARLLWIAPEDEQMRLQTGLANCPYLQLVGEAKVTRIRNGRVW